MAAPHQAVAQRQDLSHKAHGQDLVALGAAHHASEHRQKDVQGGTWRPGKDGRLQAAWPMKRYEAAKHAMDNGMNWSGLVGVCIHHIHLWIKPQNLWAKRFHGQCQELPAAQPDSQMLKGLRREACSKVRMHIAWAPKKAARGWHTWTIIPPKAQTRNQKKIPSTWQSNIQREYKIHIHITVPVHAHWKYMNVFYIYIYAYIHLQMHMHMNMSIVVHHDDIIHVHTSMLWLVSSSYLWSLLMVWQIQPPGTISQTRRIEVSSGRPIRFLVLPINYLLVLSPF